MHGAQHGDDEAADPEREHGPGARPGAHEGPRGRPGLRPAAGRRRAAGLARGHPGARQAVGQQAEQHGVGARPRAARKQAEQAEQGPRGGVRLRRPPGGLDPRRVDAGQGQLRQRAGGAQQRQRDREPAPEHGGRPLGPAGQIHGSGSSTCGVVGSRAPSGARIGAPGFAPRQAYHAARALSMPRSPRFHPQSGARRSGRQSRGGANISAAPPPPCTSLTAFGISAPQRLAAAASRRPGSRSAPRRLPHGTSRIRRARTAFGMTKERRGDVGRPDDPGGGPETTGGDCAGRIPRDRPAARRHDL